MTKAAPARAARATQSLDAATVAAHCRSLRLPTVGAQFATLADHRTSPACPILHALRP